MGRFKVKFQSIDQLEATQRYADLIGEPIIDRINIKENELNSDVKNPDFGNVTLNIHTKDKVAPNFVKVPIYESSTKPASIGWFMRILLFFFNDKKTIKEIDSQDEINHYLIQVQGNNVFKYEVVGENSYLENIAKILGGHYGEIKTRARLKLEPYNKHDPKAIAVIIDDLKVGYISKAKTKNWQELLERALKENAYIDLGARIWYGPNARNGKEQGSVKLDVPNNTQNVL